MLKRAVLHHSAAAHKGRVREDWRSLGRMERLEQAVMS